MTCPANWYPFPYEGQTEKTLFRRPLVGVVGGIITRVEQDHSYHCPVLLEAVLDALKICSDGLYIDATFGQGGHAGAILKRLGPQGRLWALDKDPEAVRAGGRFKEERRFAIEQGSFALLGDYAERNGIRGKVCGLLLDLGVSSPQLEDVKRGFSFTRDGPLDMRIDPTSNPSAAEWLARAKEREIAEVLKTYGEERYARRIARTLVEARDREPLRTTGQLVALIKQAVPWYERHKHQATRSFQAIRMHINQELQELKSCLDQSVEVLACGGRLVVISFHSLEDRLVKRFIRREARGDEPLAGLPLPTCAPQPRLRQVGKVVRPTRAEIARNPRARSALMRTAERLPC
jgi:S-adenosyl-methyltransferase MraW